MTNQLPPELFAERPVQSDMGRRVVRRDGRRVWLAIGLPVLLLVIAGFALTNWLTHSGQPTEIPTIKAEGNIKQKPEQPGGIDIPHQDVTVFDQIENNANAPKKTEVEHLLPPPEAPQAVAPEPAPVKTVETLVTAKKTVTAAPVEAAPASQPTKIESLQPVDVASAAGSKTTGGTPQAPIASTVTAAPVKAVQAQAIATQAIGQFATTPKSAAAPLKKGPLVVGTVPKDILAAIHGGNYFVQFASLPDQNNAQKEMVRLQSKLGASLGGSKLHVERADIPGKGTFYRIQAGPMAEKSARDACVTAITQKASCIIIRP